MAETRACRPEFGDVSVALSTCPPADDNPLVRIGSHPCHHRELQSSPPWLKHLLDREPTSPSSEADKHGETEARSHMSTFLRRQSRKSCQDKRGTIRG